MKFIYKFISLSLLLMLLNNNKQVLSACDPCTVQTPPATQPTGPIAGVGPNLLAFSPDGRCLAVANDNASSISLFGVSTNASGQCTLVPNANNPIAIIGTPVALAFIAPTCLAVLVSSSSGGLNLNFYTVSNCSITGTLPIQSLPIASSSVFSNPSSIAVNQKSNCLAVGYNQTNGPSTTGYVQLVSFDSSQCSGSILSGTTLQSFNLCRCNSSKLAS